MRRTMRTLLIVAAALGPLGAWSQTSNPEYDLSIARKSLIEVIAELSRQTGQNVSYLSPASSEQRKLLVGPLEGRYTLEAALTFILARSPLTYKRVNDRTIALIEKREPVRLAPIGSNASSSFLGSSSSSAAGAATAPEQDVAAGRKEIEPRSRYEEVIVTAQKRSERLQDVPVPVSAIPAESLARNNQMQLREYFTSVPGLNFTSGNRGEPFIAIRGITTTPFANPTVGITIDDVPFGPTSIRGGGLIAPDIDPSDLARVEVLRGPQGTLYGVSSLGGLVKFVTADPSTEAWSGQINTGITSVKGGDDVGYSVRGYVNMALSETFALRASGFTRHDPGYVDDPVLGIEDVNEGEASGGRLSALWKPSNELSLRLSAIYQDRDIEGSSLVSRAPGLGDLEQIYPKGSGWYKTRVEAYSANLSAQLGAVELTSITGYNVSTIQDSVDLTPFYGAFVALYGADAAPFEEKYKTRKLTQELRFTLPMGERFEWLFGGFYTDEDSPYYANQFATDFHTGAVIATLDNEYVRSTYEEKAVFADLTVRVTQRFDVQIGGRKSDIKQTLEEEFSGPLWGGVVARSGLEITDDPFTYLLTPRFRVSPDLMLYGRFASGYRAGGINGDSALGLAPDGWAPDETRNYELGVKGRIYDRMLAFDASVFYIDWEDIQIQSLSAEGVGFISNGGGARSRGVELALDSHPLDGLSLTASVAWTDAEVTEGFGPTSLFSANAGDRLPFTSRFASQLSANQEFVLVNDITATIGASLTYVGEREGLFRPGTLAREEYPSYTQVDLRGGLEMGSWSANLFVNNVGDKRGVLGGGQGAINPLAYIYIQPRTVGLSFTKSF